MVFMLYLPFGVCSCYFLKIAGGKFINSFVIDCVYG